MTTWTVSSNSELLSTLKSYATSGDTILLETGSYGTFQLDNHQFSDYVTIKSADPNDPAVFTTVDINNSSYIHLDSIHVSNPGNGSATSKLVSVEDGSHHVTVSNSEMHGRIDGEYQGWYGLYSKNSSFVRFENNDIHDVKNGIVVFSTNNIEIVGNELEYLGNDDMKFGGVSGVLIEDNTGATNKYKAEGAHVDFIQFQGGGTDIVIRGNVSLQGDGYNQQGIFLSDSTFHNVLIEQNVIVNSLLRGISVSDGSNIIARDNTVLTVPGQGHKASLVILPSGSVKENNIESHVNSQAGFSGSNLKVQWDKPNEANYYDALYENISNWPELTIEDLRPVPGSSSETIGAHARISELLNAEPPVVIDDIPVVEDAAPPLTVEPLPEPVSASLEADNTTVEPDIGEQADEPSQPTVELPVDSIDDVPPTAAEPGEPISYWSMSAQPNGRITDSEGISDAQLYVLNGKSVSLADATTIPGPNGDDALLFGEGQKSFAYAANDQAYQVLNGTVSAWFNPTSLESTQAILSKDESHADDGGHFHIRIEPDGYLLVRVADGDGSSNKGYNHEWLSKEPVVEQGNWQHVALSFGVAGISVYYNGEAISDAQFEKVGGAGDLAMSDFVGGYAIGNDKPFVIGANAYASRDTSTASELGSDGRLTHFFEGGIADVGFWGGNTPEHALSAGQVAGLYAQGQSQSDAEPPVVIDDIPTAAAPLDQAEVVNDEVSSGDISQSVSLQQADGLIEATAAGGVDQEPQLVLLQDLLSPGPNNHVSSTASSGNDLLIGTVENDSISANWGDDRISGGLGDDNLNGEDGNDLISGGRGNDDLDGGFGDDILVGEAGHDAINGGRGADVLIGGSGNDILEGGIGEDVIYAGSGTNTIDGGTGADVIVMDGHRDDYTIEQNNMEWTITNAHGSIDQVSNVEHVYFSGSEQTYELGSDGTLRPDSDSKTIEALLEGELLSELLNLPSSPTPASTTSVDAQLAEMAELDIAQSGNSTAHENADAILLTVPVVAEPNIDVTLANEDDFRLV
ncbi:MAG: right-handed parallel beta-helix repeat-containing protein [Pseudomonadota bacterium]